MFSYKTSSRDYSREFVMETGGTEGGRAELARTSTHMVLCILEIRRPGTLPRSAEIGPGPWI